jgi:hypothetical protein
MHEQGCHSRENEWDGKEHNGMKNCFKRVASVLKIPLITTHEWKTGINDTILNGHKLYLLFIIGHYNFYFINEIKLFYLVYIIKYR